ncbi:TetR/AcrR family transcriptional regulator [Lactobacillus sp. YT155]|uniref:TetR/AcrR family transcriptional regulator n=1 Tax=Lactobacillus sp. YT155 TaxID=3060955 RepID=UPI00265EBB6A|nr:TetR/AcrR family transcriptional regulator [Lactobacillus sp. YT155]MDO1604693.1 TetR/AcrR family transcriptional regulator [Lactobacillus sp. YT155]
MHTKEFDEKKKQILDISEFLFFTKGYEVTSVNTILKELGIAKGTFYYYFDSKEEVMDSVITRIINSELKFVTEEIINNKDMTAVEKLIAALFRRPPVFGSQKEVVEKLYDVNNALMKQRAMQNSLELSCPVYAEIIIEGNEKGEFSSDHPLEDIQFLIAGMQTVYDISSLKDSKVQLNIDSVIDTMIKVLNIDETKVNRTSLKALVVQKV